MNEAQGGPIVLPYGTRENTHGKSTQHYHTLHSPWKHGDILQFRRYSAAAGRVRWFDPRFIFCNHLHLPYLSSYKSDCSGRTSGTSDWSDYFRITDCCDWHPGLKNGMWKTMVLTCLALLWAMGVTMSWNRRVSIAAIGAPHENPLGDLCLCHRYSYIPST
jgi:hypothetical protein